VLFVRVREVDGDEKAGHAGGGSVSFFSNYKRELT
jgi:hypothetical protein